MTQTLRRELIQVIKKDVDAWLASSQGYLGEEIAVEVAGNIADNVLKVAGIANSPAARKFSDPYWDLFHGGKSDENAIDLSKVYTSIAERLEKGLLRNEFPQTNDAQKVYRWIAEREANGESLDTWIKWAMDGSRSNYSFVYHQNPIHIKRDWPQAFANRQVSVGRVRSERLSDE